MNILTDIIPAAWRKAVYAVYAVAGVTIGAVDVALDPNPAWLTTTLAVYAFLGTALGLVAASNVTVPQSIEDHADEQAAGNDKTGFPYDAHPDGAPFTQPH